MSYEECKTHKSVVEVEVMGNR